MEFPRIWRIDLHLHTGLYSPCSNMDPRELCEEAIRVGLDAIAITEHHYQWRPEQVKELQAEFPRLKIYSGVEVSCRDGRDIVIIGSRRYGNWPRGLSVKDVVEIAGEDSFLFLAHVFRFSRSEEGLKELLVHGIEVNSVNILRGMADRKLYMKWRHIMDWKPLYNSDAHSVQAVGAIYNIISLSDGLPEDEIELAKVLKRLVAKEGVNEEKLSRIVSGR